MYFFGIIIIIIFFCLQFFFTQNIYSKNYFIRLFVFAIIIPFSSFFFGDDHKFLEINIGLIIFYYAIFLLLIKVLYKKINRGLIRKNLLNNEYADKDFTYTQWNSHNTSVPYWWEEKFAFRPSWLDRVLSVALIIIPFIIFIIINFLGNIGVPQ